MIFANVDVICLFIKTADNLIAYYQQYLHIGFHEKEDKNMMFSIQTLDLTFVTQIGKLVAMCKVSSAIVGYT